MSGVHHSSKRIHSQSNLSTAIRMLPSIQESIAHATCY